MRLHLRDGTFADLWTNSSGSRYAFHWEHRAKRGLIHRYDNAPDHPDIATSPKHLHNGEDERVVDSHLSDDLTVALREFLSFVRSKLTELGA